MLFYFCRSWVPIGRKDLVCQDNFLSNNYLWLFQRRKSTLVWGGGGGGGATGNQTYLNMAIFKMYLLSYEFFATIRQVGSFAIEMIDIVYLKSYYNCQDKYADIGI